ncbi:MAG: hypothetical protein GQ582_03490 [Methyloprofundus sp.]|nr:hypothetical protein [Methyloprofundus sp.]
MSIKAYSSLFFCFLILISSLLALINYSIDPYMIFQSPRIEGFNDKKIAAANRSKLYKPYNVTTIQPKTLIVGNSRPEMGLDPESSCWPTEYGTVYNLTFPGSSSYGQVRALYHAIATNSVKNILLAVDFADFLTLHTKPKNTYWSAQNSEFFNRLLVDEQLKKNPSYNQNKIIDYASALFSLNALNDSISTLMLQSKNSINRTVLGFNPARDYQEIIQHEGAWILFEQKQKELKKRFEKTGLNIYDADKWSTELEGIKRVLQLSADKNIHLTLFINPYHYTYLEEIRTSGYWGEFESFKRRLTAVVEEYSNGKVDLWDFSLYSKYTLSPVPQKHSKTTQLGWFWEPAHYKSGLGELMLADMLAGADCTTNQSAAVGIKLNKNNIEAHLSQQKKQQASLPIKERAWNNIPKL